MRRAEAGPVDIATATARLSSTTGDGAEASERLVQQRDARPVGLVGGRRDGMALGDRRLQPVRRPAPADAVGASECLGDRERAICAQSQRERSC